MYLLKLNYSSIVHFIIFIGLLILALSLTSLDAYAADPKGDASKYLDVQAGADMKAVAIQLFNWLAYICVVVGLGWLGSMLLTGDRDYWKRAAFIIIIGIFGNRFIAWVEKQGGLDKGQSSVSPESAYVILVKSQPVTGLHNNVILPIINKDCVTSL